MNTNQEHGKRFILYKGSEIVSLSISHLLYGGELMKVGGSAGGRLRVLQAVFYSTLTNSTSQSFLSFNVNGL